MRKVLLVTGASGGIGAATARIVADRGYDLALGYDSDAAGANAVAAEARAAGARVLTCRADVADPDAIAALFAETDAEFGRLDARVNNAGVVDKAARVTEMTHARLAHTVPMQRTGSAAEVAEAILYLLSDRASYITGTTLDVSGGR